MLYPPGFYFVKKPKRFVILSADKSSERNLSSFFDIKKPRRIEHLQSKEPFSSDPYFSPILVEPPTIFWCQEMVNWQVFHNLPTHNYKIDTLVTMYKSNTYCLKIDQIH